MGILKEIRIPAKLKGIVEAKKQVADFERIGNIGKVYIVGD